MASRRTKRATGGRVGLVLEDEGVAVVNRSNEDVMVNDPEPPHRLEIFQAGNIAAKDRDLNCVRFFTRRSAETFQKRAGDALEFLTIEDGKTLLLTARQMGSFAAAYKKLRKADLIDLSQTPTAVKNRASIVAALKQAGMRDHDIPEGASVRELRQLHQDFLARRTHLKLHGLERPTEEAAEDGTIRALDLGNPAANAAAMTEIVMLRGEIEELGGSWHPGHKAPALRAQVEQLKALQKKAAQSEVA